MSAIQDILKDISAKKFSPLYFFYGTEDYFLDKLNNALDEHVLQEFEKAFNLTTFYGKDATIERILDAVTRVPMMSERQLVFLKEAQLLEKAQSIEKLESYFAKPNPQTVFVVNYKKEKLEKSVEKILKNAVIYNAAAVKEREVSTWITSYIKERGYSISEKAVSLLVEFLGSDLAKITNELEKLIINKEATKKIDEHDVELYIGINKEYNMYELQRALGNKDVKKIFEITAYFSSNPKAAPFPLLNASLYKFYTEIFQCKLGQQLSSRDLAKQMGLSEKQDWLLKDPLQYAKNYSLPQVENCLKTIYKYDLVSKGIAAGSGDYENQLREMMVRLLL